MASSITDVTSQLGGRRSASDPYQPEKRKKGPDEQFFGRPSVLYLVISRQRLQKAFSDARSRQKSEEKLVMISRQLSHRDIDDSADALRILGMPSRRNRQTSCGKKDQHQVRRGVVAKEAICVSLDLVHVHVCVFSDDLSPRVLSQHVLWDRERKCVYGEKSARGKLLSMKKKLS